MSNVSELFKRLVKEYAGKEIEHPQLKVVTVAQWALESGWGTSRLSTEHYNFGGLKWRQEMEGYANKVAYEAHDGTDYYCKFVSLEAFIKGYWKFIQRAPYAGWEEHTATGEDFIRFIGPTYCPQPGYVDQVMALMDKARSLLAASSGPEGEGPTPGQPLVGTVVIDPGHGGQTTVGGSSPNNATSPGGVKEKVMTLDMGLRVKEALAQLAEKAGHRLNVVMTRTTDVNVGIKDRAKKAQTNQADLFLSIHFNGFNHQKRGVETYVRAVSNGNVNYQEDKAFAQKIQTAVFNAIRQHDPKTKNTGVLDDTQTYHGVLGVLNDAYLSESCRACLVEIEYIDVKAVDDLLNHAPNCIQVRQDIAQAIAGAIVAELG